MPDSPSILRPGRAMTMPPRRLVLASSSRYRRQLLDRLGLAYTCLSPDIDESPGPDESPEATALRLAQVKAQRIAATCEDALIIGSDQVAVLDSQRIGKPGDHDTAAAQLRAMSGRVTVFHTAVCLLDASSGALQSRVVPTRVRMRSLDDAEIERYLRRDQPYDCAGSAKIEAFGITLVEAVDSEDPTALIGLPLIALCAMLRHAGVALP
jgi:septum formation protein